MYLDQILFLIGGISGVICLMLMIFLVITKKQNRSYTKFIDSETEKLITVAMRKTSVVKNEHLDETEIEISDETEAILDLDYIGVSKTDLMTSTEIISENDITEILTQIGTNTSNEVSRVKSNINFSFTELTELYNIESEIFGGGMSRVFIVTNKKLTNKWIAKYIPSKSGELTNEENILKLLNHINLPSIIDIFKNDSGICIVQSYIEGETMDKVLSVKDGRVSQSLAKNWAEQLGQVFNYLHTFNEIPIYHLDMKPSNIMVTHDNKLVIIDFGISKEETSDLDRVVAVTFKYAAPEQLKMNIPSHYEGFIKQRYGDLPEERFQWKLDARTDIYCLGLILFEMITGELPVKSNLDKLKNYSTNEFSSIILKCLEINPKNRYQTATEFLDALESIKELRYRALKKIYKRKVAVVSVGVLFLLSGASFASGNYIFIQETSAVVGVDPDVMVVSLQQFSRFLIEKETIKGEVSILEPSKVDWSYSKDNIAYIEGNQVFGVNEGLTTLHGTYRNKNIDIKVNVVKPLEGQVSISQIYNKNIYTNLYAGTTMRESLDGNLESAEFVSPESIAKMDDGRLFVSDSGKLRMIENGFVSTIDIDPSYLTVKSLRVGGNALYILTNAWEDDIGSYYGIIKLEDNVMEGLYLTDAVYSRIEDYFVNDDCLYFIEYNAGLDETYLKSISLLDYEEINVLATLDNGASGLAFDDDQIYISNKEKGIILKFNDNQVQFFAGVEGERNFIDGTNIQFYAPSKMYFYENSLYVWDFNTIRKVVIENGIASKCETITGIASPSFDLNIEEKRSEAYETILPNSNFSEFTLIEDKILITDPKRGVIWQSDYY